MITPFTARDFRDALGLFATGIAVATSSQGEDKAGITINSFASVSLEPPLVLFSVSKNLRSHDVFKNAAGFAINVLSKEQREVSAAFARAGGDKWSHVETENGANGGIVIRPSLVSFDCKLHCKHDGGDHTIFIGEVTTVIRADSADPLIYFRSQYHALASTPSVMPA